MRQYCVLALLLISLCSFVSSDIQGRWATGSIDIPTDDKRESMSMKCSYTFYEGDVAKVHYEIAYVIQYDRKLVISGTYDIKADAMYACGGDSISVLMNMSTAQISISEDDVRISGIGTEDAVSQRQMKAQICEMLRQNVEVPLRLQGSKMDVLNDVKVDGKRITCTLDGQSIVLKRRR